MPLFLERHAREIRVDAKRVNRLARLSRSSSDLSQWSLAAREREPNKPSPCIPYIVMIY